MSTTLSWKERAESAKRSGVRLSALLFLVLTAAAPPDAGVKPPPKPKSPPSAIEPAPDSKDEQAIHKIPALEEHLRNCAAKAFPDAQPKGCVPVLIGLGKKGELTFVMDRERPSMKYEDGEKCLREYSGTKPAIKKGSKLRVPVCF